MKTLMAARKLPYQKREGTGFREQAKSSAPLPKASEVLKKSRCGGSGKTSAATAGRFLKCLLYRWSGGLSTGVTFSLSAEEAAAFIEESILALSQTKRNPVIPIISSVTSSRDHRHCSARGPRHCSVDGAIESNKGLAKMMMTKNQGKSITGAAAFRKR